MQLGLLPVNSSRMHIWHAGSRTGQPGWQQARGMCGGMHTLATHALQGRQGLACLVRFASPLPSRAQEEASGWDALTWLPCHAHSPARLQLVAPSKWAVAAAAAIPAHASRMLLILARAGDSDYAVSIRCSPILGWAYLCLMHFLKIQYTHFLLAQSGLACVQQCRVAMWPNV